MINFKLKLQGYELDIKKVCEKIIKVYIAKIIIKF